MDNKITSHSADVEGFFYTGRYISEHPDGEKMKNNIFVERYTYGVPMIQINRKGGKIYIGNFCSLANGTKLYIHPEHRPDWITTYPFPQLKSTWPRGGLVNKNSSSPLRGHITIGNDVWIGANVTILGGADIGDGAVIGAECIVAGKIPPYAIVVGNPARVLRYRFDDDTIAKLLELKWWNWPIEKIQEHADLLSSDRIGEILALGE